MAGHRLRRVFLRDVCYFAAASGFAGPAQKVLAGESQRDANQVRLLDLGFCPVLGCFGGVVFPRDHQLFLTFPAIGQREAGTGFVAFDGCLAWRSSGGEADHLAANSVDGDRLESCRAFEVLNSTWSQTVAADRASSCIEQTRSLRHFVFTFFGRHEGIDNRGKHFECLSHHIGATLLPAGSFLDVVDYVDQLCSPVPGNSKARRC